MSTAKAKISELVGGDISWELRGPKNFSLVKIESGVIVNTVQESKLASLLTGSVTDSRKEIHPEGSARSHLESYIKAAAEKIEQKKSNGFRLG